MLVRSRPKSNSLVSLLSAKPCLRPWVAIAALPLLLAACGGGIEEGDSTSEEPSGIPNILAPFGDGYPK